MKKILLPALSVLMLTSCTKDAIDSSATSVYKQDNKVEIASSQKSTGAGQTVSVTTKYTIRAGQDYCDQKAFKSVKVSQMNFTAKFDNSAIYTTIDPVNQYEINKLYGFSEGSVMNITVQELAGPAITEHCVCTLMHLTRV